MPSQVFVRGLQEHQVRTLLGVAATHRDKLDKKTAKGIGKLIEKGVIKRPAPAEYHSVFLSYGGPDAQVARRFYDIFCRRGIACFFFPETAKPGVRLHRTMSDGVNDYDRVLLLCSESSLKRRGVLNELEQILIREANDGGSELLIPVALDDYVFDRWRPKKADIARQVRARVVADFREASKSSKAFGKEMERILAALRKSG